MKKTLALVIVATMLLSLFAVFGTVSATEAERISPRAALAVRDGGIPVRNGVDKGL